MLGRLLPPGFRPLGDRGDLLRQRGQVMVVEGLDVRVRRGLLHPDDGPASLDGDDDLQLLRWSGLALGVGLVSGVIGVMRVGVGIAMRVLCGLLAGVLLLDDRSGRVVRLLSRVAEDALLDVHGVRAGRFRSVLVRHGLLLSLYEGALRWPMGCPLGRHTSP